jgi:peptide/nickel transport system permease protein
MRLGITNDPALAAEAKVLAPHSASRLNRWDNPWLNKTLLTGVAMLAFIVVGAILGRILWNADLAFTASSPLNLPPVGFENTRGQVGSWAHPLGTENSGRDMLALLIVGAPATLMIGLIAATVGMTIGILLGFSAGFLGGWVDDVVRIAADTMITIPAILVLIVVQSVVRNVDIVTMALLLSAFFWPGPTRLIRAQVLSMRESGYVKMARLSGVPTFNIMFKEMMPNLTPYLAASFIGNTTGVILTAIGLEVLGLGPQRVPTLGVTIFYALEAAAILRNMWWWWFLPTLVLVVIFIGLLLINLGLDEVANPRLRKARE